MASYEVNNFYICNLYEVEKKNDLHELQIWKPYRLLLIAVGDTKL